MKRAAALLARASLALPAAAGARPVPRRIQLEMIGAAIDFALSAPPEEDWVTVKRDCPRPKLGPYLPHPRALPRAGRRGALDALPDRDEGAPRRGQGRQSDLPGGVAPVTGCVSELSLQITSPIVVFASVLLGWAPAESARGRE